MNTLGSVSYHQPHGTIFYIDVDPYFAFRILFLQFSNMGVHRPGDRSIGTAAVLRLRGYGSAGY
jgi:hypothetical protein